MNKIKAIITDLDRTLLRTDKSVSRYTLDILQKCHERGILVMAASARPMRAITDNALYEEINGILTDDVYSSIAQKDLIQIMNKKATKWNGIKEMISYYNISSEEVLFFGDDNDDLEPIIKCGTGVAVSNAIPSVFEAADKVTTSNDEDGVARFIEENII